ncbi:phosphoglycerate mutase family protein [Rhizobium sp. TRM95111]|uniref:histidine phosphatase family protein n=1 Tax=Rhizobium alarense TaxID=2846851 RepID=UPI001F37FF58|nr:histidine phosphatase family protein [Rhizobium alarense]MCF3640797.1 phosphoglycerate mutase family protein [Rhizobium alarense]
MLALYISHPQVRIDASVPVPDWQLSDCGRARARNASATRWMAGVGRLVSSGERKAIETAEVLADGRVAIEIRAGMGENDRSATGFLDPPAFEAAADRFFAHPEKSYRGWERAIDAQRRIAAAVDAVLTGHDPSVPIAFVGHGGVGTLLKCHLAGQPISRLQDQPAGGGNLFAFRLADRAVTCNWTPMESFEGFDHGSA